MTIYTDKDGKKVRLKKDGTPDRRSPPKEHQFKQKQSGNPSGRPKGRRTLSAAASDLLNSEMVIKIGGKSTRMSKADAVAHALFQQAMTGDPRAARELRANLPVVDPVVAKQEAENEAARKEFQEFFFGLTAPLRPLSASGILSYREQGEPQIPKWLVDECWRRYSRETRTFDHGEMGGLYQLPETGRPDF